MNSKDALFQEWYRDYAPGLRNFLFRIAGASPLDDLVQETFLKVWRAMDGFDGRAQPRTWIYRIAHNTAMDRFRQKWPDPSDEIESLVGATEPRPELADLIAKGVGVLSETLRPAFVLHYQLEFSVADIAGILDVPEGTVKTRLKAAREKFIEFLRQNGVEHEF